METLPPIEDTHNHLLSHSQASNNTDYQSPTAAEYLATLGFGTGRQGGKCRVWPYPLALWGVGIIWLTFSYYWGLPHTTQLLANAALLTLVALGLYLLFGHILQTLLQLGQVQYQTIQQNPLPMLVANADGMVMKANKAAQRLYGLPTESLLGSFIETLHTSSKPGSKLPKPIAGQIQDAGLVQICQGPHAGRWVQLLLAHHQHAKPERLLAVVIDKTSEVIARQDAASYARRLQTGRSKGPDGYLALDRDFKVIYCNAAFGIWPGLNAESSIGQTIWEAAKIADAQERMALVNGMTGAFVEQQKHVPETDAYYRLSIHPTHFGLAVLSHDITLERQKAEQQNREAQLLRQAIEQSADCIWIVRRNYEVAYGNGAYLALRKDLVAKPEANHQMRSPVVMPRQPKGFSLKQAESYQKAFEGEVVTQTGDVVLSDGEIRTYQAIFSPVIEAEGQVSALICTSRNITAIKAEEESLKAQIIRLKTVAWFQSHEVRGPLARILGILQLLQQPAVPADEHAAMIAHLSIAAKQLDDATRSIAQEADL